jgi:adenylate kinase family enzyme
MSNFLDPIPAVVMYGPPACEITKVTLQVAAQSGMRSISAEGLVNVFCADSGSPLHNDATRIREDFDSRSPLIAEGIVRLSRGYFGKWDTAKSPIVILDRFPYRRSQALELADLINVRAVLYCYASPKTSDYQISDHLGRISDPQRRKEVKRSMRREHETFFRNHKSLVGYFAHIGAKIIEVHSDVSVEYRTNLMVDTINRLRQNT